MKIQFVEEDPKVFDEVNNIVSEYIGPVDIVRLSPMDLKRNKCSFDTSDLVLFDLDCKKSNSLELFEYLIQKTTVPIVAIDDVRTGPNRLIKALHFGASEYLLKPFSKNLLISTIISHKDSCIGNKGRGCK